MTAPETAAKTATAAKMTSASSAKVLTAATPAPKCHGAGRHRRGAEGKNCNHHFAQGISPWLEFDHCLALLKFISVGADAASKDKDRTTAPFIPESCECSPSVRCFAITCPC
jgi:hypothetical protein